MKRSNPLATGVETAKAQAEQEPFFCLRRGPATSCTACGAEMVAGLGAYLGEQPLCLGCLPLVHALELALLAGLDLAARCWYELWRMGGSLARLRPDMAALSTALSTALENRGHPPQQDGAEAPEPRQRGSDKSRELDPTETPSEDDPSEDTDPHQLRLAPVEKDATGTLCGDCALPTGGPVVGMRGEQLLCPACLGAGAPGLGHLLALFESCRAYGARRGRGRAAALARVARRVLVYGALRARQEQRARVAGNPSGDPLDCMARSAERGGHAPAPRPTGTFFSTEVER